MRLDVIFFFPISRYVRKQNSSSVQTAGKWRLTGVLLSTPGILNKRAGFLFRVSSRTINIQPAKERIRFPKTSRGPSFVPPRGTCKRYSALHKHQTRLVEFGSRASNDEIFRSDFLKLNLCGEMCQQKLERRYKASLTVHSGGVRASTANRSLLTSASSDVHFTGSCTRNPRQQRAAAD